MDRKVKEIMTMGQRNISVRFSMHLTAVLEKKEKWYIARCPVLDVYSQGETEEQAKKNLSEALAMFLISCHERGTLDAVLKNCGFVPDYSPTLAKETIDHAGYIDVPLPFLVNMGDSKQCHV